MTSPFAEGTRHRGLPALYFVLGQIVWFACVISAAKGFAWAGELVAVLFVTIHISLAKSPSTELKLVASVTLIGFAWESMLVSLGLIAYPTSASLPSLAPLWLPALWAAFAAQLNITYGWLKPRLWMAALLGALAGPLSFRAGGALGALSFPAPVPAIAALAIGWAVLLPIAITLSRRWPGAAAG